MPSISVPVALAAGAGLTAAGGVASAVIGGNAAKQAAQTQANAANQAAATTLAMFNTTQQNLSPYIQSGYGATSQLQGLTGTGPGGNPLTAPLTAPFQPTMAQLAATPGYQFTLQQGLQATQNSYAAQGLGSSGSALKGAAQYAENLASTTYQQQFQNYLTQNQQIYGMLANQQNLGENAAAMTGQQALSAAGLSGNYLTSGAAATAGGIVGSANALTGGISSVGNAANTGALMLALNNSGLFGGATANTANTGNLSYALGTPYPIE